MLPYGIMGIICLQAAITAMFLPETKGKPTLETLDDMVQSASSTPVKFIVTDELLIANKTTDCNIE